MPDILARMIGETPREHVHDGVEVFDSIRLLYAPDGRHLDEAVHGEEGLLGNSVYQCHPE